MIHYTAAEDYLVVATLSDLYPLKPHKRGLNTSKSANGGKYRSEGAAFYEMVFGKLKDGVNDGVRTRDNRNHNPGLYQLSYAHH